MNPATTIPPLQAAEVAMQAEDEFAEVFATLWPRLLRTATAIAGDRSSAEDAVQMAFARAYASWARVRRADHVDAYLRRMVVNEILGSRRSGWFRRERPYADVDPRRTATGPEDGFADRDVVWTAVQALPVRQRAVIVLRYYEDLSEEQIAAALACSRGTVKSQASAALANLRRFGASTEGGLR